MKYYLEKKVYQDDLLSIFNVETEDRFCDQVVNPIIRQFIDFGQDDSDNWSEESY